MVFSTQLFALLQRKLGVAAFAHSETHIAALSIAARWRDEDQMCMGRSRKWNEDVRPDWLRPKGEDPTTSARGRVSLDPQRGEHALNQRLRLTADVYGHRVVRRLQRIELRLQQRRIHVVPLALLKTRAD